MLCWSRRVLEPIKSICKKKHECLAFIKGHWHTNRCSPYILFMCRRSTPNWLYKDGLVTMVTSLSTSNREPKATTFSSQFYLMLQPTISVKKTTMVIIRNHFVIINIYLDNRSCLPFNQDQTTLVEQLISDSGPINDTNHEKLIFSLFKQVFTQYNIIASKKKL